MSEGPLGRLVRREEDLLDRERLADLLEGLVFVDPEREKVLLTREAMSLSARKRVVLTLLGRKVLRALGETEVVEEVRPIDIQGPTGLKGGTIRPRLRELYDEGIIAQRENGYYVPTYSFEEAASVIKEQ